jgi:hypothetical protein
LTTNLLSQMKPVACAQSYTKPKARTAPATTSPAAARPDPRGLHPVRSDESAAISKRPLRIVYSKPVSWTVQPLCNSSPAPMHTIGAIVHSLGVSLVKNAKCRFLTIPAREAVL